jgi:hypothetical protein
MEMSISSTETQETMRKSTLCEWLRENYQCPRPEYTYRSDCPSYEGNGDCMLCTQVGIKQYEAIWGKL